MNVSGMIAIMNDKNQTPPQALNSSQIESSGKADQPKKSKRLRLVSTLFMLALIAVTLVVIFRDTSLSELWNAVRSANLWWLLGALGAALFASLMFGVALHIALRALYGKPISFLRNIGFGFVGQYYTSVTPAGVAG